jgi:hypothetical protein
MHVAAVSVEADRRRNTGEADLKIMGSKAGEQTEQNGSAQYNRRLWRN